MAFARFGLRSDVYVYEDTRGGFTCEWCSILGKKAAKQFRTGTAAEMVAHLLVHRERGDKVPEDALDELGCRMKSRTRQRATQRGTDKA